MATYGVQIFNAGGALIFDSNTHRVMKYIKTIVSPTFTQVGNTFHYVHNIPEMTLSSAFVEVVSNNGGYTGNVWLTEGQVHMQFNVSVSLIFYRF